MQRADYYSCRIVEQVYAANPVTEEEKWGVNWRGEKTRVIEAHRGAQESQEPQGNDDCHGYGAGDNSLTTRIQSSPQQVPRRQQSDERRRR